jgi:hypothetical protein
MGRQVFAAPSPWQGEGWGEGQRAAGSALAGTILPCHVPGSGCIGLTA